MASINILPTWNGLGLEQSCTISIFLEKEGGKTCDILQTALPFTTSNKVNMIPSVVQIVFSNLKIISICCLNGCIIHVMQCPALVHVGYWCIYPFSLDMLGSSHKCTHAFDLHLSAFDCVVQTKYLYII